MKGWEIFWTEYLSLCSLHIAALNVCTINQMRLQAAVAKIFETFKVDVCCVSEERIQDPYSILVSQVQLHSLVPGDPISSSPGQAGVGITLTMQAV